MMTCQEFTEFIMAWLDGELSPEQLSVFDRHLLNCGDCERYLDSYRKAVALGQGAFLPGKADADGAPGPEVPEDLVQAVLAARRKG